MSRGVIHPPQTLFLRQAVGKVTNDENGNEYEIDLVGAMSPCVKSLTTGQWWTISWDDLVQMAVEAGVDER